MATRSPAHLSAAELLARQNRIALIAGQLGIVGRTEYCHEYSQKTGGMQYRRADTQDDDLLVVFAEAFERDADPDDFSLEAMIAHERGHQILAWHSRIAKMTAGIPLVSEEILASLLGSIICPAEVDRECLYIKAAFELVSRGQSSEAAHRQLQTFKLTLEALL
jgi:hypothetical protein